LRIEYLSSELISGETDAAQRGAAPAPPAALSGGISQKSAPESFHTSYWSSELTFAKYWAAQRGASPPAAPSGRISQSRLHIDFVEAIEYRTDF